MGQTFEQAMAMGSPIWPATIRNLLIHCAGARRNMKNCRDNHRFDYTLTLNQAQRCLVRMRQDRKVQS